MKLLSRNDEIVLLAVWRLNRNAYGVTIREQVSAVTGHEWSFGAIYVPLDSLTRRGFITKTLSEPTTKRGGRSKCMYTLSDAGKYALKRIRKVEEALWEGIPGVAFD